MTYDKPKVTIDLEEYNWLKGEIENIKGDEYVKASKMVIAEMINNRLDPNKVIPILQAQGILFSITTQLGGTITHESVNIKYLKK